MDSEEFPSNLGNTSLYLILGRKLLISYYKIVQQFSKVKRIDMVTIFNYLEALRTTMF